MPPRRRRQLTPSPAVSQPAPPTSPGSSSDAANTDSFPAPPAAKRRTVADNAKDINDMKGQLVSMTSLLRTISEKMSSNQTPVEALPSQQVSQPPLSTPHVPDTDHDTYDYPLPLPISHPTRPTRSRHASINPPSHPYSSQQWLRTTRRQDEMTTPTEPLASTSARNHYREMGGQLNGLNDHEDLQARVAHLVTSSLAPLGNPQGKRLFPHFYVKRGAKRTNTSLGELSLPEFNFGFLSLMNASDVFDHDKPFMLKHLYCLNEDAMVYEWSGVRGWSEEVCARIAGGTLTWDDDYKIDLLRLKLSQQRRVAAYRDSGSADHRDRAPNSQLIDMPMEVRAAKPGPPCRAFNAGNCPSSDHHTYMGYRRLHVCSHCILQKCTLLPHSKEKCKSKLYAPTEKPDRAPKSKDGPGFGK